LKPSRIRPPRQQQQQQEQEQQQQQQEKTMPTSTQPPLPQSKMSTTTTTTTTIKSLGRHSLSLILSYLEETEGTSLMICRKLWTRNLLPIFRIEHGIQQQQQEEPKLIHNHNDSKNKNKNDNDALNVTTTEGLKIITTTASTTTRRKIRIQQNRHKFDVVPVPDSTTRLAQLNTKRYRRKLLSVSQRRRLMNDESSSNTNHNKDMTTQQLAHREWMQSILPLPSSSSSLNGNSTISTTTTPVIHLPLEPPLLQFHRSNLRLPTTTNTTHNSSSTLFLPGTTLLASYPRSGNTMVRTMIEYVTGFVTGSDTRPDRPLSVALANNHGLVGEGIVSASMAPICKSHWPERVGWDISTMDAHRVIVLVRHPLDAIDSYWHMNATNSHTDKVTEDVYNDHMTFYHSLVKNEMDVWMRFLDYYDSRSTLPIIHHPTDCGNTTTTTNNNKVQVLWVRYEDLIQNPKSELERIFQFCTTEDWWRRRLDILFPTNNNKDGVTDEESRNSKQQQRQPQQPAGSHKVAVDGTSSIRKRRQQQQQRRLPPDLVQELHEMDDKHNGWLLKLGYHMFEQGFPNNIHCLPPIPHTAAAAAAATMSTTPPTGVVRSNSSSSTVGSSIPINRPSSQELRSKDSPFGRNMREWRRVYTYDDTKPFPTTTNTSSSLSSSS
jgi:hypothetical protein